MALWRSIEQQLQRQPSSDVQHVLDGGALLHRVPWPQGSTYDSVCDMYVRYVTQKYGTATVIVFDGYTDEPTIKDAIHLRRTGITPGVAVHFSGDMIIQSKKDQFLNNKENKQRFLVYLSDKLERAGCITDHAKNDADVLIVQTAIASARTKDTILVGDDTDLLVLLLHHADLNAHKLFLAPEPKKATKTRKIWCIKQTKELLGPTVCDNLLFIHAILGCDSTSRLFGIGKGMALKKLQNDTRFVKQAKVFSQSQENVGKDTIISAGEKALVSVYGGEKDESLDMLRYKRFCNKVTQNSSPVEPQTLPPTSSAAKFHSLRVFFQIMEWKGRTEHMDPQDWGWHIVDGRLTPIMTDQPAAPPEILDVVCCHCKKDCSTKKCTCKKHGLPCTDICGECRGTSCTNSQLPDLSDDYDELGKEQTRD